MRDALRPALAGFDGKRFAVLAVALDEAGYHATTYRRLNQVILTALQILGLPRGTATSDDVLALWHALDAAARSSLVPSGRALPRRIAIAGAQVLARELGVHSRAIRRVTLRARNRDDLPQLLGLALAEDARIRGYVERQWHRTRAIEERA